MLLQIAAEDNARRGHASDYGENHQRQCPPVQRKEQHHVILSQD